MQTMITEKYEFIRYGTEKMRFAGIVATLGEQMLMDGKLPISHGYSYLFCRETYQKDFGFKMGLDLLLENPNVPYKELVKQTEGLE